MTKCANACSSAALFYNLIGQAYDRKIVMPEWFRFVQGTHAISSYIMVVNKPTFQALVFCPSKQCWCSMCTLSKSDVLIYNDYKLLTTVGPICKEWKRNRKIVWYRHELKWYKRKTYSRSTEDRITDEAPSTMLINSSLRQVFNFPGMHYSFLNRRERLIETIIPPICVRLFSV